MSRAVAAILVVLAGSTPARAQQAPMAVPSPPTVTLPSYTYLTPAFVDIRSKTNGVTLEARLASDHDWRTICRAPCTGVPLDPRLPYRLAGNGLIETDVFGLAPGVHRLTVDPAPRSGRTAGTVATVLGGIAVGVFIFAAGDVDGASPAEKRRDETVGGVALGVGLLGLVAGISSLIAYRTSFTIDGVAVGAVHPAGRMPNALGIEF